MKHASSSAEDREKMLTCRYMRTTSLDDQVGYARPRQATAYPPLPYQHQTPHRAMLPIAMVPVACISGYGGHDTEEGKKVAVGNGLSEGGTCAR